MMESLKCPPPRISTFVSVLFDMQSFAQGPLPSFLLLRPLTPLYVASWLFSSGKVTFCFLPPARKVTGRRDLVWVPLA